MAKTLKTRLKKLLSRRRLAKLASSLRPEAEKHSYECPICGYSGTFDPVFGHEAIRFDVSCPQCGSRERHRFQFLFVAEQGLLSPRSRLLHFAPEKMLRDFYVAQVETYISADVDSGRADLALNIEDIDLEDATVDIVVANHVLEHVDHVKALAEIFRILRKGGIAILSFPMISAWETTYENTDIVTDAGRHLHFGQSDHTRFIGRDVEVAMSDRGFVVEAQVATGEQCARYALGRGEVHYVCRKPA